MRMTPNIAVLLLLAAAPVLGSAAMAQQYPALDARQFPLNQMAPVGTAAQWWTAVGRTKPAYFQPVRVSLPAEGQVTFYEAMDRPIELAAPAQAGLLVGNVYRLKVSGLAEFPGVEFYPSIELIDRLHPPAGREEDFPVDFEFTSEEFEWAANGRLVTKVIYLEQPQRVPTTLLDSVNRIQTIEPNLNAVAEADSLGRPMAIVRLGGRTPDPLRPDPNFFGPGAPIRVVASPKSTEGSAASNPTGKRSVVRLTGYPHVSR